MLEDKMAQFLYKLFNLLKVYYTLLQMKVYTIDFLFW